MEVKMKKGGRNFFNRTGILAVGLILFVVGVAGCTSEQGQSQNREDDEVVSPWEITLIQFDKKPSIGQTTILTFTVSAKQDLNNARLKVETPKSVLVKGEKVWRQELKSGKDYSYKRELVFTEYGLHIISVKAGMYNQNGSVLQDNAIRYVNLTKSGAVVTKHPPKNNQDDETNEEDVAPTGG